MRTPVRVMDANTEPIIAVVGFPVGGNPSQFALERALQSVDLEWRVFSFNVAPDQLSTALEGLEVLGVQGVLICKALSAAVCSWRSGDDNHEQSPFTDCLFREMPDAPFVKFAAQQRWLEAKIEQHASMLQREINKTFVIGEIPDQAVWRTNLIEGTIEKMPRKAERIVEADLIIIEQGADGPVPIDVEQWPRGKDSILVIDHSPGHPGFSQIRSLGYSVISPQNRRLGMLCECFRRWTSIEAPRDVILDAIEEYLAV